MNCDSMILKTHFYLIVSGLKNAFQMLLTPLLYRYLTVLWQSSSGSKKELGILVVVKCSFFWRLPLPFLSNGHRGTLFSTLFFLSDGWKYNSAVCERAPLACFLTLPNWAKKCTNHPASVLTPPKTRTGPFGRAQTGNASLNGPLFKKESPLELIIASTRCLFLFL